MAGASRRVSEGSRYGFREPIGFCNWFRPSPGRRRPSPIRPSRSKSRIGVMRRTGPCATTSTSSGATPTSALHRGRRYRERGRTGRFAVAATLLFLALAFAHSAAAHSRSQSFSNWHLGKTGPSRPTSACSHEKSRAWSRSKARASTSTIFLLAHLERTTRVRGRSGDRVCPRVHSAVAARDGPSCGLSLRFACPAGSDVEIDIEGFFEVAPSHVHFSRVRRVQGAPVEYLYTDSRRGDTGCPAPGKRRARHSRGAPLSSVMLSWVSSTSSIGLDHVAFLLALLLLLSRRLRDVVLDGHRVHRGPQHYLDTGCAPGVLRPNVAVDRGADRLYHRCCRGGMRSGRDGS